MRVAELPQLPPNRHALYAPPRFGRFLYCRLPTGRHEGFELLGIGNLVRMAPLVASFCLHIARGLFARQPRRMGSRLVRAATRNTNKLEIPVKNPNLASGGILKHE